MPGEVPLAYAADELKRHQRHKQSGRKNPQYQDQLPTRE
jgi:hypothetical protein